MFLLDTNIICELRLISKNKGNTNVLKWASQYDSRLFYTNVTVMMEIYRGILRIERRDKIQADILNEWYNERIKTLFKDRILNITPNTAEICAKLHIPDPSPENDAWIAASAIEHNLILVTRNTKDFEGLGIKLFNPFIEH